MTRKTHHVLVKVTAPDDLSAKDVRREVRALINHQSNYISDPEDIRARKVSTVPRVPAAPKLLLVSS
jgi:hypothetical protein